MKFKLNKTEASRLTREADALRHIHYAKRAYVDSVCMPKYAVVNLLLELICSGQLYSWRSGTDFFLYIKEKD
jgi:hypothetical protein